MPRTPPLIARRVAAALLAPLLIAPLLIAPLLITAVGCRSNPAGGPGCGPPLAARPCRWCCDDYRPRPEPCVQAPWRGCCDDYCPKPPPCVLAPWQPCCNHYAPKRPPTVGFPCCGAAAQCTNRAAAVLPNSRIALPASQPAPDDPPPPNQLPATRY